MTSNTHAQEDILVILSPGFAANEADSTCLPAQQQLVRAINKNFPEKKIIIVAFQYPFSNEPYDWFGNTIIPIGGKNRKYFYRIRVWMQAWKKIKTLNRNYRISGLLCFWYGECAFIGKLFAKKYSIKYFSWLLGQDARPGNKYVPMTAAQGEELIAISSFTADEFMQNYGIRPAHIITNGITPALFGSPPAIRNIDLLGVGSLIALKQYDIFIEVVAQVKAVYPTVRAVLCGSGIEKQRLECLIIEKGLENELALCGELTYADTLQMMQRSKILLHPSSYEGYSGVCLEALYAGAHVVSFCNPKKDWVRQWNIVRKKQEMGTTAIEIITNTKTEYKPQLLHNMNDLSKELMQLFC